jgi:hypothetical protein
MTNEQADAVDALKSAATATRKTGLADSQIIEAIIEVIKGKVNPIAKVGSGALGNEESPNYDSPLSRTLKVKK